MARSQNDMQNRQHLFLLGFMGCGKSYWGRLLAEKLGRPFLDLDDWITGIAGLSIPEIFEKKGEFAFRAMEREALKSLAEIPPSVIATGGGTPCFFDNMEQMNAWGTTIYLKTPPTLLADRLRHEKGIRPLLSGVKEEDLQHFIQRKVEEREPFYLRAKVVLEQEEGDSDLLEKMWALSKPWD